jgi:hypothetical protein
MKHLIIGNAIADLAKHPNTIKFTNKQEFKTFLDKQRYFSLSAAHCFYSEADYNLSKQGDARFRDGYTGISEADRGCVLNFDCGTLVAVWNENESLGYIVPSKNQRA